MTCVDAMSLHFNSRWTHSCLPKSSPGRSQPAKHSPQESRQEEAIGRWTSLTCSAFCHREEAMFPSTCPRGVFHAKLHNHNKIFTVFIGEIKPTHRCHISQIPSVDQTSRLWEEDIPAGEFRAQWLRGPFPSYFLSCTLSLCCLCNADKSIHQKISSVKLNQERSCQRERNRLN